MKTSRRVVTSIHIGISVIVLATFVITGWNPVFAIDRPTTQAVLPVALPIVSEDSLIKVSQDLLKEATVRGKSDANLKELVQIGHRLSGSIGASKAVEWAKAKMESYGFDRVWLQSVSVPNWTRGNIEKATIVNTEQPVQLKTVALGNSVGTGPSGVEGDVIEVKTLQEVESLGSALKGKIVFYNRSMDKSLPDTFDAYDGAVDQRSAGPSVAAKQGAVAVLVRSLTTLPDDDHPHTGVLSYQAGIPKIPAAALSTHAANLLSELLKKNTVRLKLELSAQRMTSVKSFNVIGELKGNTLPDEYVVVGGHLDSWDLGAGAQDDGAGVVQSIEVLRSLKALGLRPKRTVRAVIFMAEEFGGIGAEEYAKQAKAKNEKHVAAIESDRGGFAPVGFAYDGEDAIMDRVRSWDKYLSIVHANKISKGFSGTDVEPLDDLGTASFGFVPDSAHYFDFHHSALDQIEAVNSNELKAGAAAMAVFAYLLAEQGL